MPQELFNHNPEKNAALDLWLRNPLLSPKEVAIQVGITERTVARWRREPEFVQELVNASRKSLQGQIPAIYHVCVQKALEGDYRFAKIILDHIVSLELLSRDVMAEHTYLITWRNDNDRGIQQSTQRTNDATIA